MDAKERELEDAVDAEMAAKKAAIPTFKRPKYETAGYFSYCSEHEAYFIEHSSCMACHFEEIKVEREREVAKELEAKKDRIELLEFKLQKEQEEHARTKLEAADYLATKKQIEDKVKAKL